MKTDEAMVLLKEVCAAVQTRDWATRVQIHEAVTTVEAALAKAAAHEPPAAAPAPHAAP